MKTIILYQCEICGSRGSDKQDAIDCEARGKATEYPVGLIYGYGQDKDDIKLIFAVAENFCEGHINNGGYWACRDTCVGDNFGESLCGGNSLSLRDYHKVTAKNRKQPCFKRLVEYLKSEGIPITIWNGKKAVPL